MNSIDCIGGYCRARREGFKSIYFLLLCFFLFHSMWLNLLCITILSVMFVQQKSLFVLKEARWFPKCVTLHNTIYHLLYASYMLRILSSLLLMYMIPKCQAPKFDIIGEKNIFSFGVTKTSPTEYNRKFICPQNVCKWLDFWIWIENLDGRTQWKIQWNSRNSLKPMA